MITVVGGIKGGGGKTTIATNLCVMRCDNGKRKVLLVDADDQRTASDWASHRETLGIPTKWITVRLSGKAILTEIKKMIPHFDNIIIDVGGRDTESQRAAFGIAHQCLIPFKPKSFDMWTLGAVKALIADARLFNPQLKAYAVINQGDCRGSDNEDAMYMIKEMEDIICLPGSISQRKAFSNAAAEGLSVTELNKPDPKAILEMEELYTNIFHT